jgi:CHAD domain-containing protein
VRDLDVHLEKAEKFRDRLAEANRDTLAPLLDAWKKNHAAARGKLVKYLDGKQYRRLRSDFEDILKCTRQKKTSRKASTESPRPRILGHVAPAEIWNRYQKVRAYESVMMEPKVETLHALRIDCKRFRYTIEALREILGEPGEQAIEITKKVQDHLGEMHDAYVAAGMLQEFIDDWTKAAEGASASAGDIQAVFDYQQACKSEIHHRVETFTPLWKEINSVEFRRSLAEATARP